jgi:hypothetical protein
LYIFCPGNYRIFYRFLLGKLVENLTVGAGREILPLEHESADGYVEDTGLVQGVRLGLQDGLSSGAMRL